MESPGKPAPRECDQCPAGNRNLEYLWPYLDRPYDRPGVVIKGSCWKCSQSGCRNRAQLVFIPDTEAGRSYV